MTRPCRLEPDRTGRCARSCARAAIGIAIALLFPASAPVALHRGAIEQIAARYTSRVVLLKGDLRAPAAGGEGMQAPMIDAKGWHFASGHVVLHSGERAEITGVFNYAERGFFLEIARAPETPQEPLIDRPRLRVRVMTDVPSADPAGQAAQAAAIIDRIVASPGS